LHLNWTKKGTIGILRKRAILEIIKPKTGGGASRQHVATLSVRQ
jgi:hypothetical protein